MASPFEDLVSGGKAEQKEKRQTLVVFTEVDCKLLVFALQVLAEEHGHTAAEQAHIDRLIERLS
jgi:hypothetical protein